MARIRRNQNTRDVGILMICVILLFCKHEQAEIKHYAFNAYKFYQQYHSTPQYVPMYLCSRHSVE